MSEALFMERFPALGLLVPGWPEAEVPAETLPSIDLDSVEVLYVYGLGRGEAFFQYRSWLESNLQRQLIFLEDDAGIIKAFINLPDASTLLSTPQVHITHLSKQTEPELAQLAEQFPTSRLAIVSRPSKQGRRFEAIKLQLLRKTTLSHALHLDRLHGYQHFHNFLLNVPQLASSFYANALKGSFQDVPAIVCGAGPSLSTELLKQLDKKALLIGGGSTLAALSSEGITPHFGIAVDPNEEEFRRLKNSFAFEMPFLYSTRVFPAVFQTCNGPFGYMRSGIGGIFEIWIEEELGLTDPLLGHFLSPESISVTSICVAWAQFLGCNPILLNGVDLAYTGKKRYANGVVAEKELSFTHDLKNEAAGDRILRRKGSDGKFHLTAVRWVMEAASISQFAKNYPDVRFINTTPSGLIIKGLERLDLATAAARFLTQEFDLRGRVHEQIIRASMPPQTKEICIKKLLELKESLHRMIEHLEILSGVKKGSTALAEMELREEMAYPYFFYDIDALLRPVLAKFSDGKERKWKETLSLAKKYATVFTQP